MPNTSCKEVLESEFEALVRTKTYEQVFHEVSDYEEASIDALINLDSCDTPRECYLKCTLFHTK